MRRALCHDHEWESAANIGFAPGYTPAERRHLVDIYLAHLRKSFGHYPKSAGSCFIDEVTLGYMAERVAGGQPVAQTHEPGKAKTPPRPGTANHARKPAAKEVENTSCCVDHLHEFVEYRRGSGVTEIYVRMASWAAGTLASVHWSTTSSL